MARALLKLIIDTFKLGLLLVAGAFLVITGGLGFLLVVYICLRFLGG